jgi:predicted nucleic acid-binding Zn ribbon protein
MEVQVKDENGILLENADVYVDGRPIGKTPFAQAKVSCAVWKTYQIRVKNEGFLDAESTSKRSFHILPFIVGWFFLWWLWLWAFGTAKIQTVILRADPRNTVRKCPMCGESILPMQTRCPACGNQVSQTN